MSTLPGAEYRAVIGDAAIRREAGSDAPPNQGKAAKSGGAGEMERTLADVDRQPGGGSEAGAPGGIPENVVSHVQQLFVNPFGRQIQKSAFLRGASKVLYRCCTGSFPPGEFGQGMRSYSNYEWVDADSG